MHYVKCEDIYFVVSSKNHNNKYKHDNNIYKKKDKKKRFLLIAIYRSKQRDKFEYSYSNWQ